MNFLTDKIFKNVKEEPDKETELAIFNSLDPGEQYESIKRDSTFFLLHRYTKRSEWVEVYKRK